jgi:dipeptidyl aminopeptidase/acylaminoacyl peptidase
VNRTLLALALAAASCARTAERPAGLGRRVAEGQARNLRPSPDGSALAWLDRCARPPSPLVPQGVVSCDLVVAPAAGGAPHRVAEGVTSLPQGLAWSPDGKALAALAEYDYATGLGALVWVRPDGERRRLAAGVGFYGFGPRGELAFAAGGQLFWAEPGREPAAVERASGVATFEFAPAGAAATALAARRDRAAGAHLLAVAGGRLLGFDRRKAVGDYAFSPRGDHLAVTVQAGQGYDLEMGTLGAAGPITRPIGRNVQSFAFSRDGGAIAYVADILPGRPGDLYAIGAGDPGVRPELLGRRVGEYRWAAATARLAWLQDFDPRVRAGTLVAGGPGAKPVVLGRNVTAFDLTPDGSRAAFLEHVTAGGYSVDLKLASTGGATADTVARGAFGFDFSPDGATLYYRTSCVRQAEACDLYAVPAQGLPAGRAPEKIADGVKSFEFDPRDPTRLLVTWARKDLVALDLAVREKGKLVAVDKAALPGSAFFLPPDSARVAYIVVDPKRAGVYVAELPR